jgi:hypothetical protein
MRRAGGNAVMVTFVENYIDEGVEETTVSTIGAIQRISRGQIMITYLRRRGSETVVVAKHVYDYEEYKGTCRMLANLEQLIYNELLYDAEGGERVGMN